MNKINSLREVFQGLSGRHPAQWPLIPKLTCAIGVVVAVIALGWMFYLSDQMDDLGMGIDLEDKLRNDYRKNIHHAVNLDGMRMQKKQVRQYVSTLEKQLPNSAEMDALLSDINQVGIGRGLQFELFDPGQVVVNEYYAELPINIKVTGRYHNISGFASDIANLARIVTLNNIQLYASNSNSKDGLLTLEAVAKTFRYLDEHEIEAQQKAKKNRKEKGK